jgi:hypothetical protein
LALAAVLALPVAGGGQADVAHRAAVGGVAHFRVAPQVADEDDFVFGGVPLKQRLRWEVAMSVRLEMMMIIKLGTLNQIYLILLDSNS